ncbi:Uncharacterized protein RNJ44_00051 [Nakaseomyces bracarensis]|uniref:Nucleoporin NUP188 n=1 Tax=Nakaseomyces bracarensis TaxID=273131 RepID=A0ABR4P0Z6_9SACH
MKFGDVAGFLARAEALEMSSTLGAQLAAATEFLERHSEVLDVRKFNKSNSAEGDALGLVSSIVGCSYDLVKTFFDAGDLSLTGTVEAVLVERNAVVDILIEVYLRGQLALPSLDVEATRFARVEDLIDQVAETLRKVNTVRDDVLERMDEIVSQGSSDDDNVFSYSGSEDSRVQVIIDLVINYNIMYIFKLLKLVTMYTLNQQIPVKTVAKWFSQLDETLDQIALIEPTHSNRTSLDNMERTLVDRLFISRLESMVSVISLMLLGLSTAMEDQHLDFSQAYLHDVETFKLVHNTLLDQLEKLRVPVVLYMWSFILYGKSVILEDESAEMAQEKQIELNFMQKVIPDESLSSLSYAFAYSAENGDLFNKFEVISTALKSDNIFITIFTSFLALSMSFVPITAHTSKVLKSILSDVPDEVVERFITDNAFSSKFDTIRAKLPLIEEGLLPFINLTAINEQLANFSWGCLRTYAANLQLGKIDYDLVDNNLASETVANLEQIQISTEVLIKPPYELDESVLMPLPKSTTALIISDVSTSTNNEDESNTLTKTNGETDVVLKSENTTNETLLVFNYEYNGWSLLGRVLQNLSIIYSMKGNDIDSEVQDFMIATIDLISKVVGPGLSNDDSINILESLSSQLTKPRDEDIVSVVFKIFERALHKRNYSLLCSCAKFTQVLLYKFPHFVWSYLSTSDLLEHYGKSGLANVILGSTELTNGEYEFTLQLAQMTLGLIDDAVATSLYLDSGVPLKTKKSILANLIVHLLNVYESFQYWKYTKSIEQRFELSLALTKAFSKTLYYVHVIDPEATPDQKVTSVLAKAASAITSAFLTSDAYDPPVVQTLINTLTSPTNRTISIFGKGLFDQLYESVVQQSYELANILVSIRGVSKLSASSLEKYLFTNSPKLIEIYTTQSALKLPIIKLLNSLVGVPWSNDYPFLYSYLGAKKSEELLSSVVADLSLSLQNYQLSNAIYIFFSTLIRSKQDGLSILFLTGHIAEAEKKESPELKDTSESKSDATKSKNTVISPISKAKPSSPKLTSLIEVLKRNVKDLETLPESTSCHLLDAIAFAFNTWTNARNIDEEKEFISSLMKKLKQFEQDRTNIKNSEMNQKQVKRLTKKYKLIARIVEIFALHLYTSKETNQDILQLLESDSTLPQLKKFFMIEGYNKELQMQLSDNITAQYPSIELSKFILSPISRNFINFSDCIFDVSTLDQFLGNDIAWAGEGGFRSQVLDASLNLQNTIAQISAAKSWGALITAYQNKRRGKIPEFYLELLTEMLQYNIDFGIEAPLFLDIYTERLELVFFILYNMNNQKQTVSDKIIYKMINQLSEILRSTDVDFLNNISKSTGVALYRPALRTILLLLSMVQDGPAFIELSSDLLLQLTEEAFCKGLYLITSTILSNINISKSSSENLAIQIEQKIQDISLLLNLVIKIQRLNPSSGFNTIFASSLYEVGTLKVILNLYSSAHLFLLNDEPLLGQLSLSIITELCSITEVAEKIVTNGLFTVLVESPLSVALQKGSLKASVQPKLHSLWSNGLLSIILLLLSEFGGKVLPETCLFVSYFTKHIGGVIAAWFDNNISVSSALIRETKQIVLLQKMLDALSCRSYLESSIRGDVSNIQLIPGLDNEADRKQLNSALNKLLTHPKYLNSRIIPTTVEEQHKLEDELLRSDFTKNICKEIKGIQELLFQSL